MRPATGTHSLRRLREFLGYQQDEFASVLHLSKSLLQKLEQEKRPLSGRLAEDIAACTGISAGWLLRNDPNEPPTDARGRPYTRTQFDRAQVRRLDLMPTYKPPILVRMALFQKYAEARDLFLRPEMYGRLFKLLLDLQLLCAKYEPHAKYSETGTAADAIKQQDIRENPDNLFPSVIKDAEQCHTAAKLQRKRRAQAEVNKEQSLAPFLPKEDRGLRTIRKRILKAVKGRT